MRKINPLLFSFLLLITLPVLAQQRDRTVNVHAVAASGESLEGQSVVITHLGYSISYGTLLLDEDGKCTVKVYDGEHSLAIDREGFDPVRMTFTTENAVTDIEVTLTERVRKPFALKAQVVHDAYTGKNSVDLSWNREEPAFFDDFESYEPFSVSFGEWTGIDADLEAAAPLVGDYANRGVLQYAQIINPMKSEPAWWYEYPILRPYSGQQYVGFTRTYSGQANDDWLISPAIQVGTQNVLSFMAKAADQFPERYQVYVTTKTDNPQQADFLPLSDENYEVADYTGWRKMQFSLADYEGQTIKFAIRYISCYNQTRSFMLMIDDVYVGQPQLERETANAKARRVRHSPDNPNECFEIYMNGEKIGETDRFDYHVDEVTAGSYVIGVRAVYVKAKSEMSEISVDVPDAGFAALTFHVTADSQLSPDGQKINIVSTASSDSYTLTVADGTAVIPSLPLGDYLVNVEKGAFSSYDATIHLEGDTTVEVMLQDNIIDPYNITVDVTEGDDGLLSAVVGWNQNLLFNESFEDYDDFATGEIGQWKSIDLDGMPVYPIGLGSAQNIVSFPGSGTPNNPTAIAPMVFNPWHTVPAMLPTDPAVAAPTGDKTIVFFSPQQAKADKWLISPELEIRDEFVWKFTAKSYTPTYPESFELCVSTDGDAVTSFQKVAEAKQMPGDAWTIYQVDLADYVGRRVRLGFHYVSTDAFFAQLDDVIVGPESGKGDVINYGNVVRFDIYLDGVLVGNSQQPGFMLSGLQPGKHVLGIQAVYKNGQSQLVEYEFGQSSAVVLPSAAGGESCLYTIDGRQIPRGVQPKAGAYLMKSQAHGKVVKKIIRR